MDTLLVTGEGDERKVTLSGKLSKSIRGLGCISAEEEDVGLLGWVLDDDHFTAFEHLSERGFPELTELITSEVAACRYLGFSLEGEDGVISCTIGAFESFEVHLTESS